MPIERDTDELRNALERHSVAGYPVEVPIFGPATIESQSTAREAVFFKVRPTKPPPFSKLAEALRYTDKQMTLKEWEDLYVSGSTRTLSFLPWEIRERLEEGGTASQKDWLFQDLLNKDCLDLEQRVTCYSFEYSHVRTPPEKLRKGMLVDYTEGHGEGFGTTRGWAGRIVGFGEGREIVLVDLFAPTPFGRTPEMTDTEKIRKGFYSSMVGVFGRGLAEAFEDQKRSLPAGRWAEDDKEYILDEGLPFDEIQRFCDEFYPDTPCAM